MKRSEMTFQRGAILRKEMLSDLYDYPRTAFESYFAGFSDGILYGLKWMEDKATTGHHMITPGALKFHGKIFFQPVPIDVEAELDADLEINQKFFLYFVTEAKPSVEEPSRTVYEMKLRAAKSDEADKVKSDKSGFYFLHVEYLGKEQGFDADGVTEELEGAYAGNDGYAYRYSPYFLEKNLLEILIEKKEKNPLDYLFIQDIYEQRGISVRMALMYIQEYKSTFDEKIAEDPLMLFKELKEACKNYKQIYKAAPQVPEKAEAEKKPQFQGGLM